MQIDLDLPVIAIPGRIQSGSDSHRRCFAQSVMEGGGSPILIPVTPDRGILEAILKRVDGVLMPGGPDVNPALYGEDPIPELGRIEPALDDFTLKVIEIATQLGLPIFGICRGAQILNVAFKGSLYQDIDAQYYDSTTTLKIKHRQAPIARHITTHEVDIEEGSLLHTILGMKRLSVNSVHHQSVRDIAPAFRVVARAPDGVIEGFEKIGDPNVFAVQWHPEEMVANGNDKVCLPLFQYLVRQAREYRRSQLAGQ
jgi:putative glutamine amidotransferase